MLLVNGARGIGTGYSTYVPPCDPAALKTMIRDWLEGTDAALNRPIPIHFKGFKGRIDADGSAVGVYRKEKEEYVVTELPPGTWTQDYREWLEKELAEGRIKDFVDTSTDTDVNIRIKGIDEAALVKSLSDKFKITNMHAFNSQGVITKYDTLNDILIEFAETRLSLYETRRAHTIKMLQSELPYHENVVRFIMDQIAAESKVVLKNKTRTECDAIFAEHKFAKIEDGFEYLMRLPVSSFTTEQIAKHTKQLAELKAEIARLEKMEPADMWLNELDGV
jgi:DNA topoisomerase-2